MPEAAASAGNAVTQPLANGEPVAGAGRELYGQVSAVIVMELLGQLIILVQTVVKMVHAYKINAITRTDVMIIQTQQTVVLTYALLVHQQ